VIWRRYFRNTELIRHVFWNLLRDTDLLYLLSTEKFLPFTCFNVILISFMYTMSAGTESHDVGFYIWIPTISHLHHICNCKVYKIVVHRICGYVTVPTQHPTRQLIPRLQTFPCKIPSLKQCTRWCIQKFPDWAGNEINNNNKHSLRSNTKGYGGKTHYTDSQNSDTTAPSGRELYYLQFSLQAASPETFGYTLIFICCPTDS
jgi:hypothetical protein